MNSHSGFHRNHGTFSEKHAKMYSLAEVFNSIVQNEFHENPSVSS